MMDLDWVTGHSWSTGVGLWAEMNVEAGDRDRVSEIERDSDREKKEIAREGVRERQRHRQRETET